MTRYDFLLFLHVGFAATWVGGAAMMQFFGLKALASRSAERLAIFAGDTEWIGSRILSAAALGAVLTGGSLVWDSPFWEISDDWIMIGLGLFAVTFVAGIAFFGPESGRVKKAIEADGPDSPAAQARIRRLIVLSRIDLVVLFLLIFDMTVKPSFDDGWTIVGALVAAVLVAALLVGGQARGRAASPA